MPLLAADTVPALAAGDVFVRSLPHYINHPLSSEGHLVEIGVFDGETASETFRDWFPEEPVLLRVLRPLPDAPAHETAHALRAALERRGHLRRKAGTTPLADWYVLPLGAVDELAQELGLSAI